MVTTLDLWNSDLICTDAVALLRVTVYANINSRRPEADRFENIWALRVYTDVQHKRPVRTIFMNSECDRSTRGHLYWESEVGKLKRSDAASWDITVNQMTISDLATLVLTHEYHHYIMPLVGPRSRHWLWCFLSKLSEHNYIPNTYPPFILSKMPFLYYNLVHEMAPKPQAITQGTFLGKASKRPGSTYMWDVKSALGRFRGNVAVYIRDEKDEILATPRTDWTNFHGQMVCRLLDGRVYFTANHWQMDESEAAK